MLRSVIPFATLGSKITISTSLPGYQPQSVRLDGNTYAVDTYTELLETEGGKALGTYTDGFCKGKSAIVKNGNVYYLGFYTHSAPQIYYDILRKHVHTEAPIHKNMEAVDLGNCRMYLNHSNEAVALEGYDLLRECRFDRIPPYGVVLVRRS